MHRSFRLHLVVRNELGHSLLLSPARRRGYLTMAVTTSDTKNPAEAGLAGAGLCCADDAESVSELYEPLCFAFSLDCDLVGFEQTGLSRRIGFILPCHFHLAP